jgi:hypothetical protein
MDSLGYGGGIRNRLHAGPVPHRKHYVSTTKPNRLMLFRETVAVYCENHKEHTEIHSVGRMQSFITLDQMVHIVTTGL